MLQVQMVPIYHSWNSSRDTIMKIVGPAVPAGQPDPGLEAGFDYVDVFKTSKVDAKNLQIRLGASAELVSVGPGPYPCLCRLCPAQKAIGWGSLPSTEESIG